MSVKRAPNGGWAAYVRARAPDGQEIRARRQSSRWNRRDAERWEAETRRRIEAGVWGEEKRGAAPTIAEYVEQYCREQVARGLKPSTMKSKRGTFEHWIVPHLGSVRLDQVKTAHFTKLRTAMVEAGRAPKTVNNVLVDLSAVVRWWHQQEDLPPPTFRANLVKVPKNRAPKFYDFGTYESLVRSAGQVGPESLAIVLLAGDAGLRMSEIRALHRGDLELGAQRSTVMVQRSREDDEEIPTKGWTIRTVPLTRRLAAALRSLPRHLRDPHVFLNREGHPLTRKELEVRVWQAQRAAGLKRDGVHILRHTFCSHLAMRGAAVGSIRELAGHESITTTQGYMHLAASALDDAIALLEPQGQHEANSEGQRMKKAP